MTRFELMALLQRIAAELSDHPEGSHELRIAQYNLRIIRQALAEPQFRPFYPVLINLRLPLKKPGESPILFDSRH